MNDFIEEKHSGYIPIDSGAERDDNNTDETKTARRNEVLNIVLEKLIDKINEPLKEEKMAKRRGKHPELRNNKNKF